MKRAIAIGLFGLGLMACAAAVPPEVLREWQSRTLYTCCNIHYERADSISDANYFVGSTLPFGSPAAVQKMTGDSVTFLSGATAFTLVHNFGRDQESGQQYFNKILVTTDPHIRFATFSKMAQAAVQDGRVEKNMTKEQVIMSLGYPPTHRTPSTDLATWTYWNNRWTTYTVTFDAQGVVDNIVGSAPTRNEPIVAPKAIPPAPVRKIQKKKTK